VRQRSPGGSCTSGRDVIPVVHVVPIVHADAQPDEHWHRRSPKHGRSRHDCPGQSSSAALARGPAIRSLPVASAATPARSKCRDLDLHRRRSRRERIRRVGPGIDSFEHRRRNRHCNLRRVYGCLAGQSGVQSGRVQLQPIQPAQPCRQFPAPATQPRRQRFLRSSSGPGQHNYLLVRLHGHQRDRHNNGTPCLQRRRSSRPTGNAQPRPCSHRLTQSLGIPPNPDSWCPGPADCDTLGCGA